jgi:hypothetical protein
MRSLGHVERVEHMFFPAPRLPGPFHYVIGNAHSMHFTLLRDSKIKRLALLSGLLNDDNILYASITLTLADRGVRAGGFV